MDDLGLPSHFPIVERRKELFASGVAGVILFLVPHPTTVILTLSTLVGGVGICATVVVIIDKYAHGLVIETIRLVPKVLRRKAD